MQLDPNSIQARTKIWTVACFGEEISADKVERNHRFLEESIELVQTCGCTKSEALQLVEYVYSRDVGDKFQEAGGVMVTLAALCNAQDIDMNIAGNTELNRVWQKIEKVRAKQKAKPKHLRQPRHVWKRHCMRVKISVEQVKKPFTKECYHYFVEPNFFVGSVWMDKDDSMWHAHCCASVASYGMIGAFNSRGEADKELRVKIHKVRKIEVR